MESTTETTTHLPESPEDLRRWRRSVWGVVALALIVRVAWALAVPIEPISDSTVYDLFARNIAEGLGYCFVPGTPTAYWPVGTAALYAPFYALFDSPFGPIAFLNAIIGVASVALTIVLTRDWFGRREALAAGLILACWPGQITFTTVLASELSFNLCWLAALFAATRPGWHPALRSVLAGVALAGACYLRPVAMLLPAVFAWIRLVGPGGPRLFSRNALMILAEAAGTLAVMMALVLPWTLRNYRAFDRPILISANGGANLWMGNNPKSTGGYIPLPDSVKGLDEATRDAVLKQEATEYIRERPIAFVLRTLVKLVRTHERETIGVSWNEPGLIRTFGPSIIGPLKVVSTAYWWAALLLGLVGSVGAIRRAFPWRWAGQPALVLWGYFAALHAVIVSGDRYHYPSVPAIASLAGLGLILLLDSARKRKARPGSTSPG